ncbi:cytidine deaminase [candidate division WOR-3 bacterium 4484_100]|uniref:Cytidine deaminase n=1 Tax=candidate division WOR-3 bacterium 4484_100 TaxID=1936077 RepID=A0A1V4QHS0_UNCW3|nr:MAG: cytidine deaminase [candidate division WOR-3 bacterium 4484_100]
MVKISSTAVSHKRLAREMIKLVKKGITNAYAPYSSIPVSAGLYCKDGEIFTGVNIENSSYSLSMCAERVALFKAVASGQRNFLLLLLYSPKIDFILPCGACLQTLCEFSPELVIATMNTNEEFKFYPLKTLIKRPFRL